jgi:hypothetical protein
MDFSRCRGIPRKSAFRPLFCAGWRIRPGSIFFRIRYRRRIFSAAERISSSVTICAVGMASCQKNDNMIMLENNGKCNTLFTQIDYEAQKPGVTENSRLVLC